MAEPSSKFRLRIKSAREDCNEEVEAHSPCWKCTACRRGSGVQNACVEAGYTRKEISGRRDGPSYELDRICRHVDFVPEGIEVGIHLCYGDPGHKHIIEPKSLRSSVEFANAIVAGSKRRVTWVHMPVPRDRMDAAYYEPLSDLWPDRSAELYLGLVHQSGGLAATRQRIDLAERFAADFGIATECGFGRRSPDTIPGLLDLHRQAAEPSAPSSA